MNGGAISWDSACWRRTVHRREDDEHVGNVLCEVPLAHLSGDSNGQLTCQSGLERVTRDHQRGGELSPQADKKLPGDKLRSKQNKGTRKEPPPPHSAIYRVGRGGGTCEEIEEWPER